MAVCELHVTRETLNPEFGHRPLDLDVIIEIAGQVDHRPRWRGYRQPVAPPEVTPVEDSVVCVTRIPGLERMSAPTTVKSTTRDGWGTTCQTAAALR